MLIRVMDYWSSPHPHTPCPIQCVGSVLLCGCIEKQKQRRQQVEFKEEITSPTFQQKCQSCQKHRKMINKIGRKFTEFYRKITEFRWKMEPKWVPGAIWGPKGPRKEKRCPKWFGFGLDWSPFWHIEALFLNVFFDAFLEGLLFGPWATFGRPRCPKGFQNGAKMEPKAYLGALWYLLYGRHIGRARGRSGRRFGVPFGAPWASILGSK